MASARLSLSISIRSARGGGDFKYPGSKLATSNFNPLRPRGRRLIIHLRPYDIIRFQSAPPAGAETGDTGGFAHEVLISIRSARGGGDRFTPVRSSPHFISIRSARGGGDYGC